MCTPDPASATLGTPRGDAPPAEQQRSQFKALFAAGARHQDTSGIHAAALNRENGLPHHAEDTGRHNAVDKVIGAALLHDRSPAGLGLLVTGRISAGPAVLTMRGAVLAGGGAIRYGCRPKGLERVGGERMLDRLVAALSAGEGPVLLVAWDMPFVPVELIEALVAGAAGYDVFLPESGGRRGVEPFCGVYGPVCVGPVVRQLDDQDYRAIGFHDSVRVGLLPLEAVSRFGDPTTLFFNVNTPDDLARAEELWRKHASSR
jgi:molybdopterin-guanine dinucleotide biosynthesis protein A